MTWTPISDSNAIERVRMLVQFSNPMDIQKLDEITKNIVEKFSGFGFEEKIRAQGIIQNIPIDSMDDRVITENVIEGWVLKKQSIKSLEEVGFRKHVFGYVQTEYTNWKSLESRFWEIFKEPLKLAIDICEINSIRLEYWDKFVFFGNALDANVSDIIQSPDVAIPNKVLHGDSLWHSHIGWFEYVENFQTLIQRNIDVIDEKSTSEPQRVLNMHTLVETREISPTNIDQLDNLLKNMQKRSIVVFGNSLTDDIREKIDLNLEDYEQ